jgi:hypothetical protein
MRALISVSDKKGVVEFASKACRDGMGNPLYQRHNENVERKPD